MRSKLITAALLFAVSLAAQYIPPGGGGGSLPTGSGNCVVASPANGSSATVACRALVVADEKAAGANGAVQFSNAGVPGGDSLFTFDAAGSDTLHLSHAFAPTAGGRFNTQAIDTTFAAAANSASSVAAQRITATIPGSSAVNYSNALSGSQVTADFEGSGTLASLYGIQGVAYIGGAGVPDNAYGLNGFLDHFGSGTLPLAYGGFFGIELDGPGNITTGYAANCGVQVYGGTLSNGSCFYAAAPIVDGGMLPSYTHFYGEDIAGLATNGYYSWFDSRGVRQVKEDNTFDSVGQAIEALYNPQFTKYVPGAADYERIILGEWNGNVAEIGSQAGGTGVLRSLRLIGASVAAPGAGAANTAVCWKAGGVIGWASNTAGVIGTTCN